MYIYTCIHIYIYTRVDSHQGRPTKLIRKKQSSCIYIYVYIYMYIHVYMKM